MVVGDIDRGMLHAQLHRVSQHVKLNQKAFLAHRVRKFLLKSRHVSGIRHIDRITDLPVAIADLQRCHKT